MDDVAPVHVLVVDDVAASRGLASIWLSDGLRGGVEVVEAATLAEMRAAWAAHRPDIVVLDQRLPDGEGLDGARELLAEDPDATIILLTGMADPGLDREAERLGVADFLVKQEIDGPMLARTVRYALRRREDRRRLRRSEERYRNLVKALPDTVHPDDVAQVVEAMAGMGDGDIRLHRLGHRDGRDVWVSVSATVVRDEHGNPLHVLGQMQDVTEQREYEARPRHLADHDPLTGLLNRRGFERALEAHIARTRRYGTAGALLVIDLDGFKYVNDTLGHHAGDQLIVACAGALRERLRETDVLARLGGDEFAVLLPVESATEATVVAGALVEIVRQRARGFGGQQAGNVTASIGIAAVDAATMSGGELMVGADLAMYEAKEAGRNQFAIYQAGSNRQARTSSRSPGAAGSAAGRPGCGDRRHADVTFG